MSKRSVTLSKDTIDAIRDAKRHLTKDLAHLPIGADMERTILAQAIDTLNSFSAGWCAD